MTGGSARLKAELIANEMAESLRVTPEELFIHDRTRRLSEARRRFWARLRAEGFSYTEIAHAVERDHSTVYRGIQKAMDQ